MHQATNVGSLQVIPDCRIIIPVEGGVHIVRMNNLPDISDTKSAVYNNEGIIGRSFPLYTYSHSGDRQISIQLHFFAVDDDNGGGDTEGTVSRNLSHLRAIQSATYPRKGTATGAPYQPPPVCRIRCGAILADFEEVCAVLQSYSVKFPTEVAWNTQGAYPYVPYRFDVDTSWLIVYTSEDLPTARRIWQTGR